MPRDTEQLIQSVAYVVTRRLHRIAAAVLPWSDRSQHDVWRAGYLEGLHDATRPDRKGTPGD